MIYMRGQSRDYDGWAALADEAEWRWERCLPYFMRHEDHWRGADDVHAAPGFDRRGRRAGGEWRVERQRLRWDMLDAFAQAAQQAGIPAHRRLQPRQQRRRRLLRGQPARAASAGTRQGLPAARAASPQPRGLDRRARVAAAARASGDGALRAVGIEALPQRAARHARRAPRARWCWPPAPSARRRCCSSRASGPARCCSAHGIAVRARAAPASARTCRTTCRSARCSASTGVKTLNLLASTLVRQGGASACSTCHRAAGR